MEHTARKIVEALSIIHSGQSANDARRKAQEFCDECKRDPAAHDLAIMLLQNYANPDGLGANASQHQQQQSQQQQQEYAVVQHFAFQVLIVAFQNGWNSWTDQQRQMAKQLLINFFGQLDRNNYARFVKSK